jgi:hypothetical protein
MPEPPVDPITTLAANMAQLHEVYLSAVAAGFAPEQAMQMVIAFMLVPRPEDPADD